MNTHYTAIETGSLIDALLAPFRFDDFMERHWQKSAVVFGNRSSDYFEPIIPINSIHELYRNHHIPSGNIDMGQNAKGAPKESYKEKGYSEPSQVLARYDQGETIILRGMHQYHLQLGEICRAMTALFRCPTQANIYITPAGTQSSYPHWDAHDIFVLQLAGSKTWTIHDNNLTLPHPQFRFNPQEHPIGEAIGEITLHPGDTAYIPRGLAHNPFANTDSVHVSLGVKVATVSDILMQTVTHSLLHNVAWREALPYDAKTMTADTHALQTAMINAIQQPEFLTTIEKTIDEFEQKALREAPMAALHSTELNSTEASSNSNWHSPTELPSDELSCSLASQIRLKRNLPMQAPTPQNSAKPILLNGYHFAIDEKFQPAIHHLIRHPQSQVVELPGVNDAEKIALAKQLSALGCLEICA